MFSFQASENVDAHGTGSPADLPEEPPWRSASAAACGWVAARLWDPEEGHEAGPSQMMRNHEKPGITITWFFLVLLLLCIIVIIIIIIIAIIIYNYTYGFLEYHISYEERKSGLDGIVDKLFNAMKWPFVESTRSPMVTNGHQWSPMVTNGHQWSPSSLG